MRLALIGRSLRSPFNSRIVKATRIYSRPALTDGEETGLRPGVCHVRPDHDLSGEQSFDIRDGNTVFLALVPIAPRAGPPARPRAGFVRIEARKHIRGRILHICVVPSSHSVENPGERARERGAVSRVVENAGPCVRSLDRARPGRKPAGPGRGAISEEVSRMCRPPAAQSRRAVRRSDRNRRTAISLPNTRLPFGTSSPR